VSDWVLELLGFDMSRIPPDARTEFMFTNAPQSWRVFLLVAIVAAIVYLVMYLYRREIDTCPRGVRVLLGMLRTATLLVLALVFLGPALAVSQKRTVQPYVVLLLDDSQSMSIPDRYLEERSIAPLVAATGRSADQLRSAKPTRAGIVDELLAKDDGALVRGLSSRGKLRVFTYSNKTTPLDTKRSSKPGVNPANQPSPGEDARAADFKLPPLKPIGQGTLTAKAIREALKSLSGNPVAGIVIISDGQDTARDDDPLAAADAAAGQKSPIFTIGVGDPSKPRNLRVSDVYADEQVWQGDPFEIQAAVSGAGLDQSEFEVELVEQPLAADGSARGASRALEQRRVSLPAEGGRQALVFKHKPKTDGQFSYSVRVPVQTGELLDSDNEKSVKVKVLKEQARVLLIAGGPSWEYRLVSGLYTRDPTINLSCWLQSMDVDMAQEGDTPITKLPYTFDQLNKYDLVMMFDPDPSDFNDEWSATLKRFLGEHAGGFLYIAGPKYASRFLVDSKTRGIRELLPVRLGDAVSIETDSLTAKNSREWPLAVVPANLDHPIMRFDTELQANKTQWERMPGIYWSFPALDPKPAARLLVEHSDPNLRRSHGARPLLVSGQFGSGRTVYMGFNGTWRWRQLGKDAEFFNKYWIQMCRYLVEGKLLVSKRRGTLETGGEKFHVGDNVPITARLFDPSFQPLDAKLIQAELKAAKSAPIRVELRPVRGLPGQFEGSVTAMQLGMNELAVSLSGDKAEETVRVTKQFEVELPRVEFEDTRLNKALLVDLATRSGGKYFEIDQVGDIPALVPDRQETIVVAGKPAELWDSSRLLILLVVLLTVEWGVRKRFKLM